jgi:hypothetical protein
MSQETKLLLLRPSMASLGCPCWKWKSQSIMMSKAFPNMRIIRTFTIPLSKKHSKQMPVNEGLVTQQLFSFTGTPCLQENK